MRIVSLVPSITLALHQLGAGDRLVGVTDYCVHPKDALAEKARIGGTKNPDLEKIRGLHPDLVIANADEQRAETLRALEAGPWDLLVTHTDSLQDVKETWTLLGQATGREEAAALKRHETEEAMDRARRASRDRGVVDVLVPVWMSPWMAAGGGTYLGDLLAACGMRNVLGDEPEKWVLFALTHDADEARRRRPKKGPFAERRMVAVPAPPHAVLLPTEPYAFQDGHRSLFHEINVPKERVFLVDGELLTWWLSHTAKALKAFTDLQGKIKATLPA